MLDALPPDRRAVVVLEVDSASVARALRADMSRSHGITFQFLERNGGPVAQASALLDALDEELGPCFGGARFFDQSDDAGHHRFSRRS